MFFLANGQVELSRELRSTHSVFPYVFRDPRSTVSDAYLFKAAYPSSMLNVPFTLLRFLSPSSESCQRKWLPRSVKAWKLISNSALHPNCTVIITMTALDGSPQGLNLRFDYFYHSRTVRHISSRSSFWSYFPPSSVFVVSSWPKKGRRRCDSRHLLGDLLRLCYPPHAIQPPERWTTTL